MWIFVLIAVVVAAVAFWIGKHPGSSKLADIEAELGKWEATASSDVKALIEKIKALL